MKPTFEAYQDLESATVGAVLGAAEPPPSSGSLAQMTTCAAGSRSQRFTYNATSGNIISLSTGRCLATADCSGASNTPIVLQECSKQNSCSGANQQWAYSSANKSLRAGQLGHGNMCLDIYQRPDHLLTLWPCTPASKAYYHDQMFDVNSTTVRNECDSKACGTAHCLTDTALPTPSPSPSPRSVSLTLTAYIAAHDNTLVLKLRVNGPATAPSLQQVDLSVSLNVSDSRYGLPIEAGRRDGRLYVKKDSVRQIENPLVLLACSLGTICLILGRQCV